MDYIAKYESPVGMMTLAANEEAVIGIWFDGQKYDRSTLSGTYIEEKTLLLEKCIAWLDDYFSGKQSSFNLPLVDCGTDFQKRVRAELLEIPYGTTITYGELAKRINPDAKNYQAVGSAVGKNPFSIVVPCHRVIGKDGSLAGYAGGIEKKKQLLEHEKKFFEIKTLT